MGQSQLSTNTRPVDETKYLEAFADRYSEAVRRLKRETHSSLWDKSKPASKTAADKKK